MRALERNADGDGDKSLIPKSVRDWYDDSDDEETSSEDKSDWIIMTLWIYIVLITLKVKSKVYFAKIRLNYGRNDTKDLIEISMIAEISDENILGINMP